MWLATNHKPEIRGTDPAIWDRIRLVPFDVRIPSGEVDRELPEKLKAELPGILAWAVRGCLDWQKNGLGEPEEVRAATEAYRAEMDVLVAFNGGALRAARGCLRGSAATVQRSPGMVRDRRREPRVADQVRDHAQGARICRRQGLQDAPKVMARNRLAHHQWTGRRGRATPRNPSSERPRPEPGETVRNS
ncbi:MAG: hypothetical protein JOZ19_00760 [Rubrobacter sp.]|nr:hypothetical protein [Rubrobacter sp.]